MSIFRTVCSYVQRTVSVHNFIWWWPSFFVSNFLVVRPQNTSLRCNCLCTKYFTTFPAVGCGGGASAPFSLSAGAHGYQILMKSIFVKYSYQREIHHRVLSAGVTTTATASTHRLTGRIRQQLARNVGRGTQLSRASATNQKWTSSPVSYTHLTLPTNREV